MPFPPLSISVRHSQALLDHLLSAVVKSLLGLAWVCGVIGQATLSHSALLASVYTIARPKGEQENILILES